MNLLKKGLLFATVAHGACGHIRKYSGVDYIVHPVGVKNLLVDFGFKDDINLLVASLLHDIIEDTEIGFDLIEDEFNVDVANLVYEVTNPSKKHPELSRKARKEMDLEHLKDASDRGKALKLADVLFNTPDIISEDPEFAKTWIPEAMKVIEVVQSGSAGLYAEAKWTLGLWSDK